MSPVRIVAACALAGFVAGSCGGDAHPPAEGDVPARGTPAGSALLGSEVTTLRPGADTSLLHLRGPFEGDQQAAAEGERYFNGFNCSGCHAPLGGGGMGPPLSDTLWIYGGDPDNIYLSIVQGRPNGMPAWNSLPPDVVWKLVAYIRTLPERKARVSTNATP